VLIRVGPLPARILAGVTTMKRFLLTLMAAAAVFSAAHVQAEDSYPPPWRTTPPGAPPTTYERWEFNSSADPATADWYANAYGIPVADIEGANWLPYYQGAVGVWYLEGYIALDIPNRPIPDERKEIWLQITYLNDASQGGAPYQAPEIAVVPDAIGSEYLLGYYPVGAFYLAVYSITIEPNPDQETIYILPRGCNVWIDEVVVDTRCIPEPASAAVLALLGLVIRRR